MTHLEELQKDLVHQGLDWLAELAQFHTLLEQSAHNDAACHRVAVAAG